MVDGEDAGVGAGVWNSVSGGAVFGPVVQAQRIDSLNVEAPPQVWPPRQLPPPLPGFVNRTKERRTLRELAEAAVGQGVRTVVVTGLGGVGKTQLIAHCVRSDLGAFFPDGQVYVDLADARRDGAVDVAGVLGDWLHAFGVPYGHQPAGLGGRADLFRTVTSGKRVLVVVDNVRQAPEIRALTPGDGLLVATSRTMLPALRMDGAVQLVVDPLDEREAIGIVRGWPVAQGDGPAAAELVRRCGGLPLALRAVGEWLVERPQLGLDDAVRSLAPRGGTERGAADRGWADEGTVDVMEQVFDSVLRQMPEHTRALYRFLGALPGTTFPAALPRAAGLPRVDAALGDLMTSHLVVAVGPERDGAAAAGPPRRFRMHDLARAHAATEAAALPEEAARSLLRTVTDFYAEAVAHADRSIGGRFRLQAPPARSPAELGFAEGRSARGGRGSTGSTRSVATSSRCCGPLPATGCTTRCGGSASRCGRSSTSGPGTRTPWRPTRWASRRPAGRTAPTPRSGCATSWPAPTPPSATWTGRRPNCAPGNPAGADRGRPAARHAGGDRWPGGARPGPYGRRP